MVIYLCYDFTMTSDYFEDMFYEYYMWALSAFFDEERFIYSRHSLL